MHSRSVPAHTAPNALHAVSPPDASWSSVNLAEAVPGVMTPLCASVWVPASELGLREPFVAMGALPTRRAAIPADPAERITNAFFGRMAVRVDFLCEVGDLIPGQSGEALSRDFFGFVPPDFHSTPSHRRLPFILARYPQTVTQIGRRITRMRTDTDAWWRREIPLLSRRDLAATQRVAVQARERFITALAAQAVISATVIQPVQEQFATLCERAGVDPAVLLRGSAHEEGVVLNDLWAASRGTLTEAEFVRRHGYHGPGEGELETRVWREDTTAVRSLIRRYQMKSDAESPSADAAEHARRRQDAERTLLAAFGPAGRLRARIVLRLARRYLPLRGTGKVAYLQSLDVLRAAARRIGALLVDDGRLDNAEDAFYLTIEELTGAAVTEPATDLRRTIVSRRDIRAQYQALTIPSAWTGQPEPESLCAPVDQDIRSLSGIGACAGIAEGRAVVVTDPSSTDIDDGDILIAHTTDPSWVSLMFLSAALVVDIGGLMSHAAVVARELGIPCVMNTGTGTSVVRTGDIIRVDGAAGTVEVISQGKPLPPTSASRTTERTHQ